MSQVIRLSDLPHLRLKDRKKEKLKKAVRYEPAYEALPSESKLDRLRARYLRRERDKKSKSSKKENK